jgi:tRNA (Thr-GGU) A37 N-methylase
LDGAPLLDLKPYFASTNARTDAEGAGVRTVADDNADKETVRRKPGAPYGRSAKRLLARFH